MFNRKARLRWRRNIKKRKQQVEVIGTTAEQGLDTHFFNRLSRLMWVWRFTASWLLLLVLIAVGTVIQTRSLDQYYKVLAPAPGGTYTEGIIGTFTSANPLYATSAADSSVSKLVFSGLMKYDQDNKLAPDLAESVTVSKTGKLYTVKIRENIKWHDGQPLTAKDVAFTYGVIKNPDARSPLFNTWKDVKVTQKDDRTIVFELPNILSTFPETLTNGIIPEHLLATTDPSQLRAAKFNTVAPVGSGPFKWDKLEVKGTMQSTRQEIIGLVPNDNFYREKPKLNQFIIRTFRSEDQMVGAYASGELTSMIGLASLPDNVREVPDFNEYNIPLTGAVMIFFKTTEPPLDDVKVRRALVQSVDTQQAVKTLGYPVRLAKGPLLESHVGYNSKLTQLPFNIKQANKYLDDAGWKKDATGARKKAGKKLKFTLYAQNTSDHSAVIGYIQKSWKAVGVEAEVLLQDDVDMQGVVSRHDYDSLLYGISIGNDPDVFAYWHSSQASPSSPVRLNLSEYKSNKADDSLEAGRTRLDPKVRAAKYEPFLKAWRDDAPALALYQPTLLYVTRGRVYNFQPEALNNTTGRYVNVENWMIRQEWVVK